MGRSKPGWFHMLRKATELPSRLHQASHALRCSSGSVDLQFSGRGANMEPGTMQSPDPTLTGGTKNALCVASMTNSPNKIALGC